MTRADKIFKDKIEFILASEKSLDKRVRAFQRKLFETLVTEFLPLFKTKNGKLLSSAFNDDLVATIDKYFDKINKALFKDVLGPFVRDLLKSAAYTSRYFSAIGISKKAVDKVIKTKGRIEKRLGVTPTGRAKKGGYLHRLGQTPKVRQDLAAYVVRNLTGGVDFADFQLGLRNLVLGTKRKKAKNVDGTLVKYFDQYAYDKFSELDAIVNEKVAEEFELEHMVYQGSLIDTSRKFCRKYAGKAFVVKDWIKQAKNDPDLVEPSTRSSYNPLTERGRYRCRHFIQYITETVYKFLIKQQRQAA